VDERAGKLVAAPEEGGRCMLLKGLSVARRFCDAEDRSYIDIDLLVSPADLFSASVSSNWRFGLRTLIFAPSYRRAPTQRPGSESETV
jgi:hypothetical protein